MKILRVLPELNYGGVETRSRLIIERLGPPFHVTLGVLGRTGAIYEDLKRRGFDVVALEENVSIRNLRCTARLAAWVRQLRPDVVHAAVMEANFHCALASLLSPMPALVLEEVGIPDGVAARSWRLRRLMSVVYQRPHRIITISEAVRRYVIDMEQAPASRVQTIMNCYSDGFGTPPAPRSQERTGPLRLLSVGRLVPEKNQVFLVDLARALAARSVDFEIRLVGEGGERSRIEERIEAHGLQSRVKLLGFRDDVQALMHDSDLLVHPALIEGYGLVVAEALASGLPVLSSRVGGIPEVMGPLADDWLVPLDVDVWASRIAALAPMSPAERAQAIQPGVDFVVRRFSPESYLEQLRQMYRSVAPAKVG